MLRCLVPAALAVLVASCAGSGAKVSGVLDGAPGTTIVIGADTLSTSATGAFKTTLKLEKNQPEFVYVTKDGLRLASLLVFEGDRISIQADTLGNCTISGSEESVLLQQVDNDFEDFLAKFVACKTQQQVSGLYVDYYRSRVKYVMTHPYSLTIIPVLTQHIAPQAPIFSQTTDAVLFRSAVDSLKTVYPESRYVKSLESETKRRENELGLYQALLSADETGFPDIIIPGMDGTNVSLAGVDAKVILLHFWDASDPQQKMLNQDILKPLYKEFHKKGFEIYSVCISANKPQWASVVKSQELPWINVCDGLGVTSRVIGLYNLQELPTSILIADGAIAEGPVEGSLDGLRKQISKLLR